MEYEKYHLRDFLMDEDFIQWVKYPDMHSDLFWETFIAGHPDKHALIEEARSIISSIQFEDDKLSELEVHEIWQDLNSNQKLSKIVSSTQSRPEPRLVIPWQRMAAVFAWLVSLTAYYFLIYESGFNNMQLHKTAYGETRSINLPDGSEVILNANSELKYTAFWHSDSVRQVWLEGEAFFSVTHQQDDQKFIVHSGNVTVEVLGTEFNVNNRRSKTQVVLNSGKVKLKNMYKHIPEEVVMKPGELVEIEQEDSGYTRKIVNTELYTSWKENKLLFDGTAVAEIAQLLEDNYGYKVVIQDSVLAKKQFKGIMPADDVDNLLGQMAKVFNADINRNEQRIIMKQK